MCRRRGRASLSFPPDDLSAIRRDQTQPPTDIAQEQQRIEICLTFAQPPVQAALLDFGLAAMPTRAEHPDHLPQGHAFTDMHSADHRLVRAADRAMVDADDRLAADRSYEGHYAAQPGEVILAAARSTPRCPAPQASTGGANPRRTSTGSPSGQPAGVGSRGTPEAGAGTASTQRQTTRHRGNRRHRWRTCTLRVSGWRSESCGPAGNLWTTVEGPYASGQPPS